MWWFVAQDLIHPPLFYTALKLWTGIGGESLLWLRLFPVFWATLALFPFLHLCRELKLKASATAIALFLFTVNGALIKYSQEVRMYSLFLCLSLFSIWLFARFFYRGKNIWILTAINILLVYTHYFGWLVVAAEVLIILIIQRIKLRHMLAVGGILLAAYLPWISAVWGAASGGSDIRENIGWISRPGVREGLDLLLDLVEPFYAQANSVEPMSILWVSVPMIAVILIAALSYLRSSDVDDRERSAFLSILVGSPIVAALLLSWLSPYSVWGSRHLIVVFAPAMILFAVFLSEIGSTQLRYILIGAIGVLTAGALGLTVANPIEEQIWCAWEKASEVEVDRKHGIIYAFEDLAAYHLWFATRLPNTAIVKVNGIAEIVEDKAYFLPRGSEDLIRVVDARDVPDARDMLGENVYFAFRDTSWNEHHQPIDFFKRKGYKVRQAFASDRVNGMQVFMGEASR